MNLKCNVFQIYVTVLLLQEVRSNNLEVMLLDEGTNDKLERKRTLCGNKLTQIMKVFCTVHNSPAEHRVKRQIVDECCHRPCSISHILDYYCTTSNREALEKYLNQTEDSDSIQGDHAVDTESSPEQSSKARTPQFHLYDQNDNAVKQDLHKPGSTKRGEHKRSTNNRSSRRRPRGKRNCSCKKHSNKKSRRDSKQVLRDKDLRKTKVVPEPKIGEIEDSQKPFYILNRFKR